MEKVKVFYIDQLRMGIDGKGVTSLVLLHGCPLRCKWCFNKSSWSEDTETALLTVDELIDEVSNYNLYYLATGGGITFGGGEPLMYGAFIEKFAKECPIGWKIRIETSLQVPLENIRVLIDEQPQLIDKWIIDVKTMDANIYKAYTGCDQTQLISNLTYLKEHVPQERILIRIPIIPEYTDKEKQKQSREILEKMGFTEFDEFQYIKSFQ